MSIAEIKSVVGVWSKMYAIQTIRWNKQCVIMIYGISKVKVKCLEIKLLLLRSEIRNRHFLKIHT